MNEPKCSIVVVNWNGVGRVNRCLDALSRQTLVGFETIVVDNASSDGSLALIARDYPWAHVVPMETNVGFAAGCNAGINLARGAYIGLLNNDAEPVPGWLAALARDLDADPAVDFVASLIVQMGNPAIVDSAGDYMGANGVAGKRGHGELADGYRVSREVFGACAGAALYRRGLFSRVGLFDEDFFLIFEDADFNFRARLWGARCRYVADAIVLHEVNASIGTHSDIYVFYGQRNAEYVFFKNVPNGMFLRCLGPHLLYNFLGLLYFVTTGRGWTFVRAKFAALRAFGELRRKRRLVQAGRSTSLDDLSEMLEAGWLKKRWRERWPRARRALFGR